ncbi:MAG: hypothetical protein WB770_06570 [Acidimicrobiales bacterium]
MIRPREDRSEVQAHGVEALMEHVNLRAETKVEAVRGSVDAARESSAEVTMRRAVRLEDLNVLR